jgi:hypothetical protein
VDASGNPVAGARNIQVALNTGPGDLSGTLSVNTGSGSTATFSNLSITGAGTHTLLFSSSGLTSAPSGDIVVTGPPPGSITIQAGDDQETPVDQPVPIDPAVLVRNANGDPMAGVTVTFQVTGGEGEVTPTTVATGTDGIATVTSWTMGPTAGPNTMTATVSGLSPVEFNATAVEASTQTSLLAAPPPPGIAGVPIVLTAAVTSSAGIVAAGDVVFSADGNPIGTVTVAAGVAALPINPGPSVTTVYSADYQGNTTFATSSSGPLTYDVAAANVPPIAQPDVFALDEDATLAIGPPGVLGNDDDDDDDGLTAQQVSAPSNASSFAFNSDGSFTYSPQADFNGSDSFSYQANDGQTNSNVATVTLTVNSVNDPPAITTQGDVATSSVVSSILGQTHPGWVTGIDPGPPDEDGQTVTQFQVLIDDDDAALFQDPPRIDSARTLSYRPLLTLTPLVVSANALAEDSGGAISNPQSFTITINP